MTGQFCTVLAGCAFAMILGTSSARAASGRIAFSGAVVAPTCAVAGISAESAQSISIHAASASREFACGAAAAPAGSAETYKVTVTALDGATKNDRLLAYFSGYITPAGVAAHAAEVVTQTFD